jgi:hypothetical protein
VNGGLKSIAARQEATIAHQQKQKAKAKKGMVEILSFSLELGLRLSDCSDVHL